MDGQVQVRQATAARLQRTARARWVAAHTSLERLAVADDYARAAAVAAGRVGVDADADLDRAVRVLWAVGESLTARLAGVARDDH